MISINKKEMKYILYSGGFAILFFMFVLPWAITMFDGNNPIAQFLFFNLGIYAFLVLFLKSWVMSSKFSLKGSVGFLILYVVGDCWAPEYHVTMQGVLEKGASLGVSSPDYVFGFIAQSLGLSGFPVYLVTYIVIPIGLLFIAAVVFKNFVKVVG